jgi:protein phosphatase
MGYLAAGFLIYARVGDSRLYRLRDGLLMQLTRDHSLIREVVDQGLFPTLADAERSGIKSNILTRGLGTANRVSVDVHDLDTRPGDLFLFCTDGLSGMVTDEEIGRVLSDTDDDLDRLACKLIDFACERGGRDNVTVALVRVC